MEVENYLYKDNPLYPTHPLFALPSLRRGWGRLLLGGFTIRR